jgi:hypothetical protein
VIHCISLTNLPSQYGDLVELRLLLPLDSTPLADKLRTTDALCLQHCERILESSGLYWELCASEHRSIMSIYPLYHTAAIALTQMKDHQHQAYSMFERACSLMDDHVDEYPLALYLLQALRVVAERTSRRTGSYHLTGSSGDGQAHPDRGRARDESDGYESWRLDKQTIKSRIVR